MNKHVNKKLTNSTKNYTTTSEVKELKETLRSYQQQSKELVKLIKWHKEKLKWMPVFKKGFSTNQLHKDFKIVESTIKHLEYFLQVYQDGIKMTSYGIQLKRQQVFESLCNYHPDKEVAKARLLKSAKSD